MRRIRLTVYLLILSLVLFFKLVENDDLVFDLYPAPYCVDNEISMCLQGDFKRNITEALQSSKSVEESFTLFCNHINYGLECLKIYSEVMCSENDKTKLVKTKLHNNLAPFDQLYAEKCGKNFVPPEMKRLFEKKGCLQKYDVLETCLSGFYYSINYFLHQDSGGKLFCQNLIRAFEPCLQQFYEKCNRDIKYDKNDMIKSLITRYPSCQAMSDEDLQRKFPSDGFQRSTLNLGLLCIALVLAFFMQKQLPN